MSIQKINIGGADVEIEDASARTNITNLTNEVNTLDSRVTTLENKPGGGGGGSEWVEITSSNRQEGVITQPFSEIRLLAKATNANYSVTYSYDSAIFHNNTGVGATYMICGNPKRDNYGCMFKYFVSFDRKQHVCAEKCFTGGEEETFEFRAWIKPVPSGTQ